MSLVNLCVLHREQESYIFDEFIGAFAYGLKTNGHVVYTSLNALREDSINIIFASHISPASIITQLPPNSIVYNTEAIGSVWMTEDYIKLLKSFQVWDFSEHNITLLKKKYGLSNIVHVPIGFCPLLERIKHLPEKEKDIDVFMYGSVNERRRKIMTDLHNKGLKTLFTYDAFGVTRDKLIARSKVILNVSYYQPALLGTMRLSYLLNNKCFVVTEMSRDWKYCEPYHYTMVVSDYGWLVDDCMEYIKAPKRRENVAECGYQLFKEYKQEDLIKL